MAPTQPPAKTSGLLRTPGDRTGGRTASSGSGGSRSSSMFGFFSEGEERMSAGLRAWLLRSRLFPEDFINDKKVGRTARNKLGKGAENQNGNLRWHLPGRGGGSRGGLVCH